MGEWMGFPEHQIQICYNFICSDTTFKRPPSSLYIFGQESLMPGSPRSYFPLFYLVGRINHVFMRISIIPIRWSDILLIFKSILQGFWWVLPTCLRELLKKSWTYSMKDFQGDHHHEHHYTTTTAVHCDKLYKDKSIVSPSTTASGFTNSTEYLSSKGLGLKCDFSPLETTMFVTVSPLLSGWGTWLIRWEWPGSWSKPSHRPFYLCHDWQQ